MNHFTDRVAQELLKKHHNFQYVLLVLPGKRASLFLRQALAKYSDRPLFAPEFQTIEEWIYGLAGLRKADPIHLLFQLYEAYREVFQNEAEDFINFSKWARSLLSDFSEIDSHLVVPNDILSYLADVKRIESWDVEPGSSDLITDYLRFWERLPGVYQKLRDALLANGEAYQGLAYRRATANWHPAAAELKQRYEAIYFVGFNALSPAEEKILEGFYDEGLARFFWDIDTFYFRDTEHQAGKFLRQSPLIKKLRERDQLSFLEDHYGQGERNFRIIASPGDNYQALLANTVVDKIPAEELPQTALLLADESLLEPVLQNVSENIPNLNVTMGLPLAAQRVAGFFQHIFEGLNKAWRHGSQSAPRFSVHWWDNLLAMAEAPMLLRTDVNQIREKLNQQNLPYLSADKLAETVGFSFTKTLYQVLASHLSPEALAAQLASVTEELRSQSGDPVYSESLYGFYTVFNRLQEIFQQYHYIEDVEAAYQFYRELLQTETLDLLGEPLTGLQVMGLLESRGLDFKNLVITSLNEEILPKGRNENTLIPYDVKRKYQLPTFQEKDSIFAYHFYRILHRAENVWLFYNSQSGGLHSGEPSRFLRQLEQELVPAHSNIHLEKPAPPLNSIKASEKVPDYQKSADVLARLREKTQTGFSASALHLYLMDPRLFYLKEVLRLEEPELFELSLSEPKMGIVVHEVLEELYEPFAKGEENLAGDAPIFNLRREDIQNHLIRVHEKQFGYRDFGYGRDMINLEVMISMVSHFLHFEQKRIRESEVQILDLEEELRGSISLSDGTEVKLKGHLDRVERDGGLLRIVDYKTGAAQNQNFTLQEYGDFRSKSDKFKSVQLIIYAILYFQNYPEVSELESAIMPLKNAGKGFIPLKVAKKQSLSRDDLPAMEQSIAVLLEEILDPDIPFNSEMDREELEAD